MGAKLREITAKKQLRAGLQEKKTENQQQRKQEPDLSSKWSKIP